MEKKEMRRVGSEPTAACYQNQIRMPRTMKHPSPYSMPAPKLKTHAYCQGRTDYGVSSAIRNKAHALDLHLAASAAAKGLPLDLSKIQCAHCYEYSTYALCIKWYYITYMTTWHSIGLYMCHPIPSLTWKIIDFGGFVWYRLILYGVWAVQKQRDFWIGTSIKHRFKHRRDVQRVQTKMLSLMHTTWKCEQLNRAFQRQRECDVEIP